MTDTISEIHEFWFGELDENGMCASERHTLWFGASIETDAYCRKRFGAALAQAHEHQLNAWTQTDRGLVALIVLLDQFSRNIHRGTAQAFAGDAQALTLAQDAIFADRHRRLPLIHRVFSYLPLEHCEDIVVQEQCVVLFEELARHTDHPQFVGFSQYAAAHRDVIARFGRFPHRNAVLGRPSSEAEIAWLAEHGGF